MTNAPEMCGLTPEEWEAAGRASRASRVAQGLPAKVSDPVVLVRIAELITPELQGAGAITRKVAATG